MKNQMQITAKTHFDEVGNLYFDVSVCDKDVVTEKRLSADDFFALFSESMRKEESYLQIPKLPDCVLGASVSDIRADSFRVVLFLKAEKRAFCLMDQHYWLPFPALIAFIDVKKGVRESTLLFALPTDEPNETTPLMNYPFGNVNSSGGCCFGNIAIKAKSVKEAPKILDAFLCGKTSADLWFREKVSKKMSQGDLVEKLTECKVFPKKLLVKAGDRTVGTLLKML